MVRRLGVKKYTRVLCEEDLKEKRGSINQRKVKRNHDIDGRMTGDGQISWAPYKMRKNCSFYMPYNDKNSNALEKYPKRWTRAQLPDLSRKLSKYDPRRNRFNSSSTSRNNVFQFRDGKTEKRGRRPLIVQTLL